MSHFHTPVPSPLSPIYKKRPSNVYSNANEIDKERLDDFAAFLKSSNYMPDPTKYKDVGDFIVNAKTLDDIFTVNLKGWKWEETIYPERDRQTGINDFISPTLFWGLDEEVKYWRCCNLPESNPGCWKGANKDMIEPLKILPDDFGTKIWSSDNVGNLWDANVKVGTKWKDYDFYDDLHEKIKKIKKQLKPAVVNAIETSKRDFHLNNSLEDPSLHLDLVSSDLFTNLFDHVNAFNSVQTIYTSDDIFNVKEGEAILKKLKSRKSELEKELEEIEKEERRLRRIELGRIIPTNLPVVPGHTISTKNIFVWGDNSCWIDSVLTALFAIPGTPFEKHIRGLHQLNVSLNCPEGHAQEIYDGVIDDLIYIQSGRGDGKDECRTKKYFNACVDEEQELGPFNEAITTVSNIEKLFDAEDVLTYQLIVRDVDNVIPDDSKVYAYIAGHPGHFYAYVLNPINGIWIRVDSLPKNDNDRIKEFRQETFESIFNSGKIELYAKNHKAIRTYTDQPQYNHVTKDNIEGLVDDLSFADVDYASGLYELYNLMDIDENETIWVDDEEFYVVLYMKKNEWDSMTHDDENMFTKWIEARESDERCLPVYNPIKKSNKTYANVDSIYEMLSDASTDLANNIIPKDINVIRTMIKTGIATNYSYRISGYEIPITGQSIADILNVFKPITDRIEFMNEVDGLFEHWSMYLTLIEIAIRPYWGVRFEGNDLVCDKDIKIDLNNNDIISVKNLIKRLLEVDIKPELVKGLVQNV